MRIRLATWSATIICVVTGSAGAQTAMVAPLGRSGVRIGTIILQPTLTLTGQYDDNIFRRQSGRTSSAILTARAGVTATTDWRRHSVEVGAAIESGLFTASSNDDYLDGKLAATAILDISRTTRLRVRSGIERRHERRGGDDTPTTLSGPVKEVAAFAEVTGQYAPGRLKVQPGITVEYRNFEDRRLTGGALANQDDRDRRIITGAVDVGFNLPGPFELTAKADLSLTDFSDARDRGGFDRDNTRLRVVAGARIDQERLVSGGVQVGYQKRWSEDPVLLDFSGPVVEAQIEWRPRRYLTLSATARRAQEETTIIGASAANVAYGQIEAVYEIQRFVDFKVTGAYERRSFRGANRRDKTLVLGIGAEWRARETTTVTAGYRYINETSTAPGESARSNIVWLAVEHRF